MTEDKLKQKINQLEQELALKQNELLQYKMQMRQVNQKLESLISQVNLDQKLIHKIQKILSPTVMPRIQGFEFSSKFVPGHQGGGDYFDIFELEDKMSFGVILANCTGYSISALLLSVLMKLSGQFEARKGLDPHKVVNLLAAEIMKDMKKNDQANLFYGIFDRRTYKLRYAMAGEIAGFFQSNGKLQELQAFGPGISLDYQKATGFVSLDLQSKDRLILCTNGITNSQNLEGESYSKDHLKKSILGAAKGGVHEVRNEILFQLEKFTQNSEPPRDVTALVIEVQDRVIKLTTS